MKRAKLRLSTKSSCSSSDFLKSGSGGKFEVRRSSRVARRGVECLIGTALTMARQFLDTAFFNPAERVASDSESTTCLTLAGLEHWLMLAVTGVIATSGLRLWIQDDQSYGRVDSLMLQEC